MKLTRKFSKNISLLKDENDLAKALAVTQPGRFSGSGKTSQNHSGHGGNINKKKNRNGNQNLETGRTLRDRLVTGGSPVDPLMFVLGELNRFLHISVKHWDPNRITRSVNQPQTVVYSMAFP